MENKKVKILCVEDEQDIRENISDILRDEGFEVFEADNGKKGYEVFLATKPDLIISDIMMPEVDGYGLLKKIRDSNNSRRNNIPFIFLTALGQKDDIVKGVNLSANDYLVKPIDFELMIAKIKEKTANAIKVEGEHSKNIKNLKSQVANVLPNDILNYLNIITQTAVILKDEPHGPLPHRKYLEDFDKIYNNANKLRAAIENALDETVIDYKLNADEEIFNIRSLLGEFINSLGAKYQSRITIEEPFDDEEESQVKCDRLVIFEALKKILSGMFRADAEANISIRIMFDHNDQMVLVFRVTSQNSNLQLEMKIDESAVGRILDPQNCRFEVVESQENTAVLIIPSYRVIS